MHYFDAIGEVLDRAAEIKLPGHRLDVVSMARQEFARRHCCDSKFIDPIEEVLKTCIQEWSIAKKREVWQSTETGAQSELDFEEWAIESIDMDLEGELMYHLIDELSPHGGSDDKYGDEF